MTLNFEKLKGVAVSALKEQSDPNFAVQAVMDFTQISNELGGVFKGSNREIYSPERLRQYCENMIGECGEKVDFVLMFVLSGVQAQSLNDLFKNGEKVVPHQMVVAQENSKLINQQSTEK